MSHVKRHGRGRMLAGPAAYPYAHCAPHNFAHGAIMRTLLFALLGAAIGYWAGAYIACTWLWPGDSLCGLPGVFVGSPLGALVGGLASWWLQRRRRLGRGAHQPE